MESGKEIAEQNADHAGNHNKDYVCHHTLAPDELAGNLLAAQQQGGVSDGTVGQECAHAAQNTGHTQNGSTDTALQLQGCSHGDADGVDGKADRHTVGEVRKYGGDGDAQDNQNGPAGGTGGLGEIKRTLRRC